MEKRSESQWLQWARQIQTIAQAAISYSDNKYEIERSKDLLRVAAEITAAMSTLEKEKVLTTFADEKGYVTPKIDIRGAVFSDQGILMVRETADHDKWTLPGGWADIGIVPSENVEREVFEEAGLTVKAKKLAAVYDRNTHAPLASEFTIYKLFFICDVFGGELTPSYETSEVRWFPEDALPDESEMSAGRTRLFQVKRMFEHYRSPDLPADFD